MKIVDIINLLKDKDKELFHKAFNIWCNFIYEKDAVYTEQLVTVFMNDTSNKGIYIDDVEDEEFISIRDSRKYYLIYFTKHHSFPQISFIIMMNYISL